MLPKLKDERMFVNQSKYAQIAQELSLTRGTGGVPDIADIAARGRGPGHPGESLHQRKCGLIKSSPSGRS